jgi:SOS-response transcriptional repressor LexA
VLVRRQDQPDMAGQRVVVVDSHSKRVWIWIAETPPRIIGGTTDAQSKKKVKRRWKFNDGSGTARYSSEKIRILGIVEAVLTPASARERVTRAPQRFMRQKKFPLKMLPIIDEITAGQEKSISGDIIGYIETGRLEINGQVLRVRLLKGSQIVFLPEYEYVAVQVSGDSMDEAGISPGDYVILQRPKLVELRPEHEDIVAVIIRYEGADATLKRILIESSRVILKPESSNPAHKPRIVKPEDFSGDHPYINVVGIAIAVLKPVSEDKGVPAISQAEKKVLTRLHINRDMETFGEAEQSKFVESIARHVRTSRKEIRLLYAISGTVCVTLEMPENAALRLMQGYLDGDEWIRQLEINRVELRPILQPAVMRHIYVLPSQFASHQETNNSTGRVATCQVSLTKLHQILDDHFNESELKDLLLFELPESVKYEDLEGEGKSCKVRELITYCQRRGTLATLEDACRRKRPNVSW